MQLLPATAADPAIGIRGIDTDAAKNIEAGAKYLRLLIDMYLNEASCRRKEPCVDGFRALYAGPANLKKMRRLAEKPGLKTHVWFQNVGAARLVGHETVQYVSNIYKYYTAYKLVKARADGKPASRGGNP